MVNTFSLSTSLSSSFIPYEYKIEANANYNKCLITSSTLKY